ncbi:MAG: polyprenyl synthetase family protein [Flavicella sp.]
MLNITDYKEEFLAYLKERIVVKEPENLYAPIDYILDLGGKRLRPILVLMGVDAFGASYKNGFDAALAVEVFHNFTLLHDDIMDAAPLRRKKPTVHEKWDVNTAILSGDAMMIMAYQLLEAYDGAQFKQLMQLFSKTSIEVCEGQQYDMDFETRNDVSIPEYIEMIRLKTSVLVAAALKMGAIIAGANDEEAQKIYDFGLNLGLAFQLQDDYLDAFGDPATFGKQIGGDIIENKKTYLFLQALAHADKAQKEELTALFSGSATDIDSKVARVKELFVSIGSDLLTQKEIKTYTEKAFSVLEDVQIPEDKKLVLRAFGESLMTRTV